MKLEEILTDISKNDHRSLDIFMSKYFSVTESGVEYNFINATSCDIDFKHIVNGNVSVFQRMLDILNINLKKYPGCRVVPMTMDELLPERFGIDLWIYSESNYEKR